MAEPAPGDTPSDVYGRELRMARFDLGRKLATLGAIELLARAGIDPSIVLYAHEIGEWGGIGLGDTIARFDLDQTVITPGGNELLERAGIDPSVLVYLHKEKNEASLRNGDRLWSVYTIFEETKEQAEEKIWIITEGNRSHTTILLPQEYEY